MLSFRCDDALSLLEEADVHALSPPLLNEIAPRPEPMPIAVRVEVFRDAAPVLDAWAELERDTPCSIYQSRRWLLPWIETLGRKAGLAPLFVLVRDGEDRCIALFCLGIVRRGPLRIATWLGGRDSNFNMPLARPDIAWTGARLVEILREAARACGRERPDVFVLKNQPFAWQGRDNPLSFLPHQPAPSAAYGTALPASAELLFAEKLSKDGRKKLRKKEAKLASLGPLTHLVATTDEEKHRVLEAFLAQKLARFREKKIVSEFDTPEMRAFVEGASRPAAPGIELHALDVGGRIVAVYGGGAQHGQWSGMFNAFDGDEEIARSSPGDLLLMRIIGKACADGISRLDLGIGEARYKAALCDETIPLFDAFVASSLRGAIAVRGISAAQMAKRAIKKNARLLKLARKIQALRG